MVGPRGIVANLVMAMTRSTCGIGGSVETLRQPAVASHRDHLPVGCRELCANGVAMLPNDTGAGTLFLAAGLWCWDQGRRRQRCCRAARS